MDGGFWTRARKSGWIKVGFDGKCEFCNLADFVQGGFLSAMLDPTMAATVIVMSEGRLYIGTVSITVNFLAPAKPRPIVAEAKVIQLGKTIGVVEGKLLVQDGWGAQKGWWIREGQSAFQ